MMDSKFVLRSIVLFGVSLLLMMVCEWLFFRAPEIEEISYTQFLDRIYNSRIERVVIGQEQIFALMKASGNKPPVQPNQATPQDQHNQAGDQTFLAVDPKPAPWRLKIRFPSPSVQPNEASPASGNQGHSDEGSVVRVTALANPELIGLLRKYNIGFSGRIEMPWLGSFLLNWGIPIALVVGLWAILCWRRLHVPSNAIQVARTKLRIDPEVPLRFTELGGFDRAIEKTREIVAFLKAPERFTHLGARLPKGVLLIGPQGAGKTQFAKALAGESGASLFCFHGPDFVDLFEHAKAAQLQDLLKALTRKAPCILFIQDLDAILAASELPDPNSRRAQELFDRLFTGMGKLEAHAGILLIGSISDPARLDSEWLRFGRFSRAIVIERPDRQGREKLFEIHTGNLVLGDNIDFAHLSAESIGMTGADIANLCNEAGLLATRCNRERISRADFQEALQKAVFELDRKGLHLNEQNRKRRAYYESGSALLHHFTQELATPRKLSIIPGEIDLRGEGFKAPEAGPWPLSRSQLMGKIRALLAGRAAEEVAIGEISSIAAHDLERCNSLIRVYLLTYGMSERLPNWCAARRENSSMAREKHCDYGAKADRILEQEHLQILESAYFETKALIIEHRAELDALAKRLLEQERIGSKELKEILPPVQRT